MKLWELLLGSLSCFPQICAVWKTWECIIFSLTKQSLSLSCYFSLVSRWFYSTLAPSLSHFYWTAKIGKDPSLEVIYPLLFCFFFFQFKHAGSRPLTPLPTTPYPTIYTWEDSQRPTWIFTLLNISLDILQRRTEESDVWSKSNLTPKARHCCTGFCRTKRNACSRLSPSVQAWLQL